MAKRDTKSEDFGTSATVAAVALAAGLLLVLLFVGTELAEAASPGENGRIAFNRFGGGEDSEIFTFRPDGSNVRQITDNTTGDFRPAFSPGGKTIAFDRNYRGRTDIFVKNASGRGGFERLTETPKGFEESPDFSPDGGTIAFDSSRDGDFEIYAMKADGSEERNLSDWPRTDEFAPAYAPDGARMAFVSAAGTGDTAEIWVMDADGSDRKRLTDNALTDGSPVWSPDGTRIAFERYLDNESCYEVYVMDADGSDEKPLTDNAGCDQSPSWSPDGRKIAFTSDHDVYTMNADGTGQRNLTNTPERFEANPDWLPIPRASG